MITLSYENSFEMSAVQKTASEALGSNGLTLQTGENVATGEQTLKISMPGTETVTTDEVQTLLDSLNESYPDNSFAQLSLSNVSAAMGPNFSRRVWWPWCSHWCSSSPTSPTASRISAASPAA